jgi:predicted metal-dependent phosphoesterase TrpH
MKNTELHTHSYYSDGDLSPSEMVILAKQKDIKNLAISDHNSLEGIEEAIKEGKKQGISIIPAIEIRAKEDEVLGYFIDYKNKELKKEINKITSNVVNRVKKIIAKLNEKGIEINFEDLIKRYFPNKNNMMEIHLIKYLKFKGFGEIKDLWKRYISKEGETYVPITEISIIDAIKLIIKYGGFPVLAHPWVEQDSKELLDENKFNELIKAGLKGIEIDNGDRDERRDDKTIERIKELAKRHNLIITSGSDFHGDYLVQATKCHGLGDYNCDDSIINKLKK